MLGLLARGPIRRGVETAAGTVTGRFVVSGVPVGASQITATLYRQLTLTSAGTINSAADGTVMFNNVPAAMDYYMVVTIDNSSVSALGKTVQNIIVTDSQTTALGDISLAATTKFISSTVKRTDGTPVASVRVFASVSSNGNFLNTYAITDAAGAYSLKVSGGY